MTIKLGWMLQVTSWENNGDFYNTKTLDGLTEDEVRAKVALCKVLHSIGQEPHDANTVEEIAAKLDLFEDEVEDGIYELTGFSDADGDEFLRVCESWKVYYIPFDLPDMTDKF